MAQREPFDERFNVEPLYQERSSSPSRQDIASRRRTASPWPTLTARVISFESLEFKDHLRSVREEQGVELRHVYRSERRTGSRPW